MDGLPDQHGESILKALDLEARYPISFWEALVTQAAQASGAEVLYSEALSQGQTYGAVRAINPLLPDVCDCSGGHSYCF